MEQKRTGDFVVVPAIEITLTIPDVAWIKAHLLGALLFLQDADNWVKVGTATPEQAAQVFVDAFFSYEEN